MGDRPGRDKPEPVCICLSPRISWHPSQGLEAPPGAVAPWLRSTDVEDRRCQVSVACSETRIKGLCGAKSRDNSLHPGYSSPYWKMMLIACLGVRVLEKAIPHTAIKTKRLTSYRHFTGNTWDPRALAVCSTVGLFQHPCSLYSWS